MHRDRPASSVDAEHVGQYQAAGEDAKRRPRLGHGHRRTVIILWLWTALLCGFVLFPLFYPRTNVFLPLAVAVLLIALFTWSSPFLTRRRRVEHELSEREEAHH